jgi:hypothetical protein
LAGIHAEDDEVTVDTAAATTSFPGSAPPLAGIHADDDKSVTVRILRQRMGPRLRGDDGFKCNDGTAAVHISSAGTTVLGVTMEQHADSTYHPDEKKALQSKRFFYT